MNIIIRYVQLDEISQTEHTLLSTWNKKQDVISTSRRPPVSPSSHPPPARVITSWTAYSTQWFCLHLYFLWIESYCKYSFVPGFFPSTLCLWDSSTQVHGVVDCSFSFPYKIPLYEWTMSLSILLLDIWLGSSLGKPKECCCERSSMSLVSVYMRFYWKCLL